MRSRGVEAGGSEDLVWSFAGDIGAGEGGIAIWGAGAGPGLSHTLGRKVCVLPVEYEDMKTSMW